ncbi:hypothetical protein CMI46_00195 [Candidatus Pacearchaeota archaeon]|nr:hypothetical protein [Candidatus Pacearchaeota archaeon]
MENKSFLIIILIAMVIINISLTGFYILKPTESSITGEVTKVDSFEGEKVITKVDSFEGNKFVTKVIDGDTVIIDGESVRLLGMDTDERGYPCFHEAKEKIEELILNKNVILEKDTEDKDQYDRYLRYIFLNGKNINLQMVEEGFAISRFYPQNIKYKEEIITAEKYARENKLGCKWGATPEPKSYPEIKWEESSESKVIGACNAGNYIGQEKTVEGKVVDTFLSTKSNTLFLNFEKPYPNSCFTAVVFSSNLYKFPENPEKYYDGKALRIKGKIEEYEGQAEIILEDLSQIETGN